MENYDKQITSEVTKTPKNKKKIVLISVIAAVVVLLILLSSLIPALILNAKIESLIETKETSDLDYFEFKPNEDETAYNIVSSKGILPKELSIPDEYKGYPIENIYLKSQTVEKLTLGKNVKSFSFWCDNLKECYIQNNSHFKIIDDIVYSNDLETLYFVLPQKKDDFVLPTNISYYQIKTNAFYSSHIANLYIPSECKFQEPLEALFGTLPYSTLTFKCSTTNLRFCFDNDILSSHTIDAIKEKLIEKWEFHNGLFFNSILD